MHYSNFLKTQKITGNIKAYVDVGGPFRQILHKPLAGHSGKYCTSRLRAIQANIAQAAGKLFRQILHKPLANLAPAGMWPVALLHRQCKLSSWELLPGREILHKSQEISVFLCGRDTGSGVIGSVWQLLFTFLGKSWLRRIGFYRLDSPDWIRTILPIPSRRSHLGGNPPNSNPPRPRHWFWCDWFCVAACGLDSVSSRCSQQP